MEKEIVSLESAPSKNSSEGGRIIGRFEVARRFFRSCREWIQFFQRNFSSPSPQLIKMKTLEFHSFKDVGWVETGTYKGDTTRFLAKRFSKVVSLEPSLPLYNFSKKRLRRFKNVVLLNGTSEDLLESALALVAPAANFWLDGHYSEGGTFLGETVSPIVHELVTIARHKSKFNSIRVFVDDVRLFQRDELEPTGYPPFVFLLDWAQSNGFVWEIQNDIFIAKYAS